jgi:hypothetical protein
MLPDDTRRKIKNIVAGAVIEREQDPCTAIRNLLCSRFATSTTVKTDFESKSVIKEEQRKLLIEYCSQHNLWAIDLPGKERFLARGGEALVYLHNDQRHVIKVNDGVYYATWLEFFNSLLLHNLIFPNTAYELIGFLTEGDALLAVLKQPFVVSDKQVELGDIEKLLAFNGFENIRRNDYKHAELGLILEDMHDENVLVKDDTLFFIDTVFYTIAPLL